MQWRTGGTVAYRHALQHGMDICEMRRDGFLVFIDAHMPITRKLFLRTVHDLTAKDKYPSSSSPTQQINEKCNSSLFPTHIRWVPFSHAPQSDRSKLCMRAQTCNPCCPHHHAQCDDAHAHQRIGMCASGLQTRESRVDIVRNLHCMYECNR